MQEPKALDWNNSWNEMFPALFVCWFVCLLFEMRAIGLSSVAGLSERWICNITKWRLLFKKTRQFYWFGTYLLRWGDEQKIFTSGFVGFLWHCTWMSLSFFQGHPHFLQLYSGSGIYCSLLVLSKQKSSSPSKVQWLPLSLFSTEELCRWSEGCTWKQQMSYHDC